MKQRAGTLYEQRETKVNAMQCFRQRAKEDETNLERHSGGEIVDWIANVAVNGQRYRQTPGMEQDDDRPTSTRVIRCLSRITEIPSCPMSPIKPISLITIIPAARQDTIGIGSLLSRSARNQTDKVRYKIPRALTVNDVQLCMSRHAIPEGDGI